MASVHIEKVLHLVDQLSINEKRFVIQYLSESMETEPNETPQNHATLASFLTFIDTAAWKTGNPNASQEVKHLMQTEFVDHIDKSNS